MSSNIISIRKSTRNTAKVNQKSESSSSSSFTVTSSYKPYASFVYQMPSNHPLSKYNKIHRLFGSHPYQIESVDSCNSLKKSTSQSSIPLIKKNFAPTTFSNYIKFPRIPKFKIKQNTYSVRQSILIPNVYSFHSKIVHNFIDTTKLHSFDSTSQFNQSSNSNNNHMQSNNSREDSFQFKYNNIFKVKERRKKKKATISFDIMKIINKELVNAKLNVEKRNKLNSNAKTHTIVNNNKVSPNLLKKIRENKAQKGNYSINNRELFNQNILKSKINTKKFEFIKDQSPIKIIQNKLLLNDILSNNLSCLSKLKI